jgi:uncharacterized membrane protein YeaQ/YmgE (transglycosylase-associated protein family)
MPGGFLPGIQETPSPGTDNQSPLNKEMNMWNLLVFALIGLLAGTAARMFYPGRQPTRILGTLVLGMAGGLAGGMFSWIFWPVVEGQFQSGNLILSVLGAVIVLATWAGVAYGRSLRGTRRSP